MNQKASVIRVVDAVDIACERDANINASTSVHTRARSRRLIPEVCGAFVAAVTRPCPCIPARFQDGKEGVDGSSPSEGSAKAPHRRRFLVQADLLVVEPAVDMEPFMEL
jgi:hypothetical protein